MGDGDVVTAVTLQGGMAGRTSACEDPTDWVIRSYPWSSAASAGLYHLRADAENVCSQESSTWQPESTDNTAATELGDTSKDSLVSIESQS